MESISVGTTTKRFLSWEEPQDITESIFACVLIKFMDLHIVA